MWSLHCTVCILSVTWTFLCLSLSKSWVLYMVLQTASHSQWTTMTLYVFRQGDLPKLNLQVDWGMDFKAWKTQWDAYLSLSGLNREDQTKQVQASTLCFSRETVTVVDNLGLMAEQRRNANHIVDTISWYVAGQLNESLERRNFWRHSQQPGESFDDFLVSLRELAQTCNFCSDLCIQKGIRNQIIKGLIEGDKVEDLLQERDLTLETAITKCQAQETARKQRCEIVGGTVNVQAFINRTCHAPQLVQVVDPVYTLGAVSNVLLLTTGLSTITWLHRWTGGGLTNNIVIAY